MADLSGTWLGTYWQNGLPTRFEATLMQSGNTLTGSILDDSYLGDAQISGTILGRGLSFTKRYLTTSPTVVHYTGTVSDDGDLIQGQWRIDTYQSGPWEAHRTNDDLMADLQTRIQKSVPTEA